MIGTKSQGSIGCQHSMDVKPTVLRLDCPVVIYYPFLHMDITSRHWLTINSTEFSYFPSRPVTVISHHLSVPETMAASNLHHVNYDLSQGIGFFAQHWSPFPDIISLPVQPSCLAVLHKHLHRVSSIHVWYQKSACTRTEERRTQREVLSFINIHLRFHITCVSSIVLFEINIWCWMFLYILKKTKKKTRDKKKKEEKKDIKQPKSCPGFNNLYY